jgi:hypothetical protein
MGKLNHTSKNWAQKNAARKEHEQPKTQPEIVIQISQHQIKRAKNEQHTRDREADFSIAMQTRFQLRNTEVTTLPPSFHY